MCVQRQVRDITAMLTRMKCSLSNTRDADTRGFPVRPHCLHCCQNCGCKRARARPLAGPEDEKIKHLRLRRSRARAGPGQILQVPYTWCASAETERLPPDSLIQTLGQRVPGCCQGRVRSQPQRETRGGHTPDLRVPLAACSTRTLTGTWHPSKLRRRRRRAALSARVPAQRAGGRPQPKATSACTRACCSQPGCRPYKTTPTKPTQTTRRPTPSKLLPGQSHTLKLPRRDTRRKGCRAHAGQGARRGRHGTSHHDGVTRRLGSLSRSYCAALARKLHCLPCYKKVLRRRAPACAARNEE